MGREILVVADKQFTTGEHRLAFNGAALPSGIYFAHLSTETTNLTQKLLLLK
jgi:hypothetical protein